MLKAVQPVALATLRRQAAQQCAPIHFRSLPGIAALVVAYSTVAEAGPPLQIDDTGILESGQWEYILAVESVETSAGKSWALTVIDASLGLTGSTQLSMSLQTARDRTNSESERAGGSSVDLGIKWRFSATEQSELAFAPSASLPLSGPFLDDGETESTLSLPVLSSHFVFNTTLQSQLAFVIGSEDSTTWEYGLAVVQSVSDRANWMLEIFGNSDLPRSPGELGIRLGVDFMLAQSFHLLASLGWGVGSSSHQEEILKSKLYFGVQWFL